MTAILIAWEDNMGQGQARPNIKPDLDPNWLTLRLCLDLFEKLKLIKRKIYINNADKRNKITYEDILGPDQAGLNV